MDGPFVQGVGAAIAVPSTISLLAREFTDPARRARVLGGPGHRGRRPPRAVRVGGGLLVDALGWSSIFLFNIPIGVVTLVLGMAGRPGSRSRTRTKPEPQPA